MNRRDFAGRIALAAAAAVLSRPKAQAAANPWRVAVIGHTGRGAYGHGLDVMWKKIPHAKIVAVADADPAGLDSARKRLGAEGYSDYKEMLKAVSPDIVSVAPRHVDEHHAMCLAALDSGAKGIYIEKPFCRTPLEADEIVGRCAAKNVKLAVAHRNRYHPVLPAIKKLIAEGEIGSLLEIRGRGKEDQRGGGEDLWVLGSHVFNLAAFFCGAPKACSGMLYQDGRMCTPDDIRQGNEGIGPIAGNRLHARFEMGDGTPFFFDSIQNRGEKGAAFGLQLIGNAGVIDLRVDQEKFAHLRRGNPHNPTVASQPWLPVTSAGVGRAEITGIGERIASHQAAGEDLIAAIEQNRPPLCDSGEGRTTIEMICAVFTSHQRNGERVPLPLQKRDHPLSPL